MQSEPVGPWWERSPGVSVEELLAANDGSGAVFGTARALPLQQPRLRACSARRSRGCAASRGWRSCRRGSSTRWGCAARRTSRRQPHAQGLSVHHLAGTLTPEPAHDAGAMAPAGQLWSTIEDLGAFAALPRRSATPTVLADETLAEMRRPVDPAHRLRPRACGWCRGPAACWPGTPARCPASRPALLRRPDDPRRGGGADQRDHRVQRHRARAGAAGRPHAGRGRAVGADDRRCRPGRRSCSATGTGATPPTRSGGPTSELEWRDLARVDDRRDLRPRRRPDRRARPATTTARRCTSYDATTARSTTSSAPPSSTPAALPGRP